MTKKIILMLTLLVGLVSAALAGVNVNKPNGFKTLVQVKNGISSYINNSENIYIIDAPIRKFKLDMSHIGRYSGKNKWNHNLYKKDSLYNFSALANNGNLYTAFNSQFFDNSSNSFTPLSFPLKGNGKIFQDKDTEKKFT
jgi:hypothetical protein